MLDSPGFETLFVRLYLDRHIMAQLALDLRGRGFDVLRTEEAGKDRASDEEQLVFAAGEKRALFTFNIRDFAPLHEQWQAICRSHAGIIVSQQMARRQYGLLLQRMLSFLNHFTSEEMINNFVHLEQFK
jgi:predicted nuclease of predicted toxin-antitoxin system